MHFTNFFYLLTYFFYFYFFFIFYFIIIVCGGVCSLDAERPPTFAFGKRQFDN